MKDGTRKVAVANVKVRVGKATSGDLAAGLALARRKILLIDIYGQGHAAGVMECSIP